MAQTKTVTQKINDKHLDMLDNYVDFVEIEKGMHPGSAEILRTEIRAARGGDADSLAWLQSLFGGLLTNERTAGWMSEAQTRAEEMRALKAELN